MMSVSKPYEGSRVTRALSNSYFICLFDQSGVVPWNPFSFNLDNYKDFIEIHYIAGVFRKIEREAKVKGMTFYVTWNVDNLPAYGDKVVVILLRDEWCRFPNYLCDVHTVFRVHNRWPVYTGNLTEGTLYSNLIALLQFVRLHFIGLPGRLVYLYKRGKSFLQGRAKAVNFHVIPLGYAYQLALPIVQLHERSTDIFFKGSLNNFVPPRHSLKYWLRSPKNLARERMLKNARKLSGNRRDLSIDLEGTEQFTGNLLKSREAFENEAAHYSQKMMNTKVALVPRGSSLDTFRFFEALRYGCVAITDKLPASWFYDGAPVLPIGNWDKLELIVDELFNDPARMEALHQAALDFWHTHCSEEALGDYITEQLEGKKLQKSKETAQSV